jgi:hypothetical protein
VLAVAAVLSWSVNSVLIAGRLERLTATLSSVADATAQAVTGPDAVFGPAGGFGPDGGFGPGNGFGPDGGFGPGGGFGPDGGFGPAGGRWRVRGDGRGAAGLHDWPLPGGDRIGAEAGWLSGCDARRPGAVPACRTTPWSA